MTPVAEPTPSQTVGPFFSIGLCARPEHQLVPESAEDALPICGRVLDGDGAPVPDAVVEAWDRFAGRWGRCGTDAEGVYRLVSARPRASSDTEAPHLALLVFARGLLKPVLTRMYLPSEEAATGSDPVLAALDPDERSTLVAHPDGDGLRFDIRLQGDRQTTFFVL
jgi:protocatechuate 3,4-dioxygenase alpha subunit